MLAAVYLLGFCEMLVETPISWRTVGLGENAEPVDFSGQDALGPCPKCGNQVYDYGMSYVCEKSVGPGKSCDFRSGKVILQQEIEPAQMHKLLTAGKTDLLKNFVSSRTRRKFSAFLVRGGDGKIGFEFEKREPRAPAKKKSAAAEADGDSDTKAEAKPASRARRKTA